MKYISLGGWCGTTISLRGNGLYGEAYPFDHVRSTFAGIVDCIEHDFAHFFPKKIEVDTIKYSYSGRSFRGRYFGFYHHDLLNPDVIADFRRRIDRFGTTLRTSKERVVFVRTVVTADPNDEINISAEFEHQVSLKYPDLNFMLVLVVPGQDTTAYHKSVNRRTFVFAMNDPTEVNTNVPAEYKEIYSYIKQNGIIPPKGASTALKGGSRFALVDGVPITREDN